MDHRLVLMHRDDKVCNLIFDDRGRLIKVVRTINPELLPPPAWKDVYQLKEWFEDRAVPKTRHHIDRLVPSGMTTGIYMLDNLALSLNDTYWLKPFEEDLKWKDVNLFANDFSAAIMNGQEGVGSIAKKTHFSKYTPDAATKGDLEKKWLIKEDGTRILVKGNFGIGCQQSLNEKFVTLINKRQNADIPYVGYDIFEFAFENDPAICCVSDNFIPDDSVEFICGYDIFQSQKTKGSRSPFLQFLDGCSATGIAIDVVRRFFDYEILLDYLVTNTDRHFNNFGIIRDSVTLKGIGMAPIYDSGSCLFWSEKDPTITPVLFKRVRTHSFAEKEQTLLKYVTDPFALDVDKLPTREEIWDLYGRYLTPKRTSFIVQCFEFKAEKIKNLQMIAEKKQDSFDTDDWETR